MENVWERNIRQRKRGYVEALRAPILPTGSLKLSEIASRKYLGMGKVLKRPDVAILVEGGTYFIDTEETMGRRR